MYPKIWKDKIPRLKQNFGNCEMEMVEGGLGTSHQMMMIGYLHKVITATLFSPQLPTECEKNFLQTKRGRKL